MSWGSFLCNNSSILKITDLCPGWWDSVDRAPACEVKVGRLDSLSGHMPGLWARSPVGGVRGAID